MTFVSIFEIRYTLISITQTTRFFNYHAVVIINNMFKHILHFSWNFHYYFHQIVVLIIYCSFTTNYVFHLTDAAPAFNTTITISENPTDYYQYAILQLICLLVFLWFGPGSWKEAAVEIYIERRLVSYLKLYKIKRIQANWVFRCIRLYVCFIYHLKLTAT